MRENSASNDEKCAGAKSEATAMERAVSALVGYVMGGVVVLPFDRVKTLMQVAAQEGRHLTSFTLARSVVSSQGIRGLYQGFQPHFMIAPYTMLYYSIYTELLDQGGGHPLAPLGAAIVARTFETTLRMPLEILRTQMQAAEGSVTLSSCVKAQLKQPVSVWFRGYVPTLLRDVPFSAIYWLAYEQSKAKACLPEEWLSSNPLLRTFLQAYCCGAVAGMIAALATTPSDVIKTVRQHQLEAGRTPTYGAIFRMIHQNPRTAFAGVGPRLIRLPLGLSTMMSGLEVTKWTFERRRDRLLEVAS
mmetsp:Transcript_75286/g.121547  ORF Transcript_75286/g.121547 Transcript_75286/m.121547 type:complete len:302 (-) Transcript_75286:242-1147(-)